MGCAQTVKGKSEAATPVKDSLDSDGTFQTTPYARSFRRRFFAFHYAMNQSHTNIFSS